MTRLWNLTIGANTRCPAVEGGTFKFAASKALDTLSGEAISLGEGPGDQHVGMTCGQIERAVVMLGRDIFGIGLIEHQQDIAGQALLAATRGGRSASASSIPSPAAPRPTAWRAWAARSRSPRPAAAAPGSAPRSQGGRV